jgi:hypothetical protein
MRRTLKAEGRGAHGEADEGERTLAAILGADVTGNSRLTGNDEPNRIWFVIDRVPVVSLSISKPIGVSLF